MHTELRIDGANCVACLNATLDALRATPGVREVVTSATEGCLAIEHDGVDVATLVDTAHEHLHGVTNAAAEIVMVSIDPLVVDVTCGHHGRTAGRSPAP